MVLAYTEYESPLGPLLIVMQHDVVLRIDYGTYSELKTNLHRWRDRYYPQSKLLHQATQMKQVIEELQAYFQGTRQTFTCAFQLAGTPYQRSVWEALLNEVPYGQTKTYQEIATTIGNPKSVRAVGGAVGRNPLSIIVPCHRIIGQKGNLVGYNGGLDKKAYLLQHEATHQS